MSNKKDINDTAKKNKPGTGKPEIKRTSSIQRKPAGKRSAGLKDDRKDIRDEEALKIIEELKAEKQKLEIKIDELRKMHLELDNSHDKYFDLYNFAPIGYLTLNESGIITEANLTVANLLGKVKAKVVNTPFTKYISASDLDRYNLHKKQMLESEVKQQLEIRIVKGDSYFWTRIDTILSMREKDGVHHLITLVDISRQKKAEEDLHNNQKLLAETEKMSKIGGWEIDINTMKQTWTEEIYNIHEVPRNFNPDVENGIAFYTKPSLPIIEKAVKRAIEYGESFNLELEIMTAKGNLRKIHTIGKADKENNRVYGFFHDITERKRMEEALRESLNKYSLLYNNTPVMLHSIDHNGKLLSVSDYWLKAMGYEREEVIGKYSSDFLTEESKHYAKEVVLPQFMKTGFCNNIEYKFVKKSGEIIDALLSAISEKDENGNVLRSLAVVTDITERIQAEKALKESNELFSLFLKHSPIYAFIKEISPTESRVIKASENYKQMIGIPGNMMEGKTMYELFPPDFAAKITADDQEVVSKGKELVLDEVLNNRYYTSIKFPITSTGRKLLAGYTIDITEQKLAENALKKSEEKYRLLHESLMDAFVGVDKDGYIIESNQAYRDMLGYTKEELSKLTYMDLTPEKWWDVESEIVNKQIYSKGYSEVYEKEYIRKDGTVFPVELRAFLLHGKDNKTTNIWGIVRDITERKKAENEIKQINEELKRINAEKDKFFSIIAHDLRSPFTGFLGFTDILKNDLQDMPISDLQNIANDMNMSAKNLFGLLTNLLEWSMIQRGIIPFKPEKIMLNNLFEKIINIFVESSKIKEIELIEDTKEDIYVNADKAMLETMIRNLVSNAIKFTPKGGKIVISAKKTGQQTEISVKDNGIGMDSKLVDNLFRIGVRTERKGTEHEPSSGLGLILCKELVDKHNGKIEVNSEEGTGSEFKIYLNNNL